MLTFCTAEEAIDRMNDMKGKMQSEVDKLEKCVKETEETLNLLKIQLYGKFKNTINLERN
jgi:chaperonin cofactor prefoldin